jgi:hypothetical protein
LSAILDKFAPGIQSQAKVKKILYRQLCVKQKYNHAEAVSEGYFRIAKKKSDLVHNKKFRLHRLGK